MAVRVRIRFARAQARYLQCVAHAVVLLLPLMLMPIAGLARQRETSTEVAEAGWAAIREHRLREAFDTFTAAASRNPQSADAHFGAGVAAYMLGLNGEAVSWLERTLALQPRHTQASVVLADALYARGQARDAIAVLEAALESAPRHRALHQRLTEWRRELQAQSRLYQAQGAHFTVLFEGPADEALARRAVDVLEAAYWRIGSILSTYPAKPITVILYTREQFRDITRAPEWSAGMYDGRIKVPMRGALDRPADLERVLAHEFVHALVDSIAGDAAPVWVNEGLATALEPGGREFADAVLRRTSARLPHAALHRSFASLPEAAASLAYAQSAVAVQRLLDLRGAPAVIGMLNAIGRGAAFEAAFQQSVYMRYDEFQASLR